MRRILKLNTYIWVLSPWIFGIMRMFGLIDTNKDWIVFIILIVGSCFATFLTFGRDEC